MKNLFRALFLVSVLASPVMANDTTYYVDVNLPGSNSNSGLTQALPFLTIKKCVQTATSPGDTCLVKNGNYVNEGLISVINSGGTSGHPITYKNFPGHSPAIVWTDATHTVVNGFFINPGSSTCNSSPPGWYVIEGFEMSGGYDSIKIDCGHDIIIRGNRLHDPWYDSILITAGLNITIDRNDISHVGDFTGANGAGGAPHSHCLYLTGTGYTITNNIVHDCYLYGFHLAAWNFGTYAAPNSSYAGFGGKVEGNTIAYTVTRSAMGVYNGPGGGITSLTIKNNVCYENSQSYSSSSQCIEYVSCSACVVTVSNNTWYGTGNSATFSSSSSGSTPAGVTTTNTRNENPSFVNAAAGGSSQGATQPTTYDFHPKSTSPLIGVGLNLYNAAIPAYTWDQFGTARSSTLPWTVGAITTTGGSGGSGGGGGTNQAVLVWSDTFNRAAEDPLTASNWVRNSAVGHQFVIPSNLATIAQPKLFSAGDAAMVWVTNALNADQYCKFVIGTISTTGDNTVGYGCSVRTSNGTKSDYALVVSSLGYDIRRDTAGSYTSLLKGSATTFASADSGMFAVHGSGANVVLEAFKNNSTTPFATVTDSSVNALQSGYAGIFYSSSETGQTPGSSTHGIDYVEGGNYFYGVDITAPTAPTGLTVTANLPAQLLISWTASTDAVGVTGYNVKRCTPSPCTPSVIVASPTTTSYTDTGLADATGYSYSVNGFDAAANQSAFSSAVSQTTQTVASPTISNCFPSGAAVSDAASIVINCTSSIPATGKYNTRTQGTAAYASLQQSMTCSGLVCSATVTPDQHGSNGGVNHFYVAFDNAASSGHASATTDLTFTMIAPVDSTAPTTISDFALTAIDSVRLGATWSAATDAVGVTGYLLSGCPGAGCTTYTITLNVAPGTSGTITGLDPSTVYNFIIQGYDAAGNMAIASNVATVSTFAAAPPEDMLNLSVSGILQQSVILQWTAPIVEQPKALFEQCRPKTSSTTCSGTWAQVAAIPLGTLPTIASLSPGTSYCWRGKFGNAQNAVSANASNIICTTTTSTGQTQQRQPAFIPRIQRQ